MWRHLYRRSDPPRGALSAGAPYHRAPTHDLALAPGDIVRRPARTWGTLIGGGSQAGAWCPVIPAFGDEPASIGRCGRRGRRQPGRQSGIYRAEIYGAPRDSSLLSYLAAAATTPHSRHRNLADTLREPLQTLLPRSEAQVPMAILVVVVRSHRASRPVKCHCWPLLEPRVRLSPPWAPIRQWSRSVAPGS